MPHTSETTGAHLSMGEETPSQGLQEGHVDLPFICSFQEAHLGSKMCLISSAPLFSILTSLSLRLQSLDYELSWKGLKRLEGA